MLRDAVPRRFDVDAFAGLGCSSSVKPCPLDYRTAPSRGHSMSRRTCVVAVIITVTLGACAQSPDATQPKYVSTLPYLVWTCAQIAGEQLKIANALDTASAQQKRTRSNDTVGVLLTGMPVSSMAGGNIAPQIAHLKGEQDALNEAMTLHSCGA
jgi:hypothetical protein